MLFFWKNTYKFSNKHGRRFCSVHKVGGAQPPQVLSWGCSSTHSPPGSYVPGTQSMPGQVLFISRRTQKQEVSSSRRPLFYCSSGGRRTPEPQPRGRRDSCPPAPEEHFTVRGHDCCASTWPRAHLVRRCRRPGLPPSLLYRDVTSEMSNSVQ